MRLRTTSLLLSALALFGAGAATLALRPSRLPEMHGTLMDPPFAATDFELVSAAGSVRLSDFRGKYVILFFGYTTCPDVCPTTMARLGHAMRLLGEAAAEVQVVLVTVDPERDTADLLARYAAGFHPSFLGLTGPPQQVAAVASSFGIHHAKAEAASAAGYLVDHSAAVTVIDREGGVRLIWPYEVAAEEIAADLRALIRG